jgi:hypothetical protein
MLLIGQLEHGKGRRLLAKDDLETVTDHHDLSVHYTSRRSTMTAPLDFLHLRWLAWTSAFLFSAGPPPPLCAEGYDDRPSSFFFSPFFFFAESDPRSFHQSN